MTEPRTDFERWAWLMDRQACDQTLSTEELEFCQRFEQKHALCEAELAAYGELAEFHGAPTDSSRGLVDRTLQRLEADDAERAAADLRLMQRPRTPGWLVWAGAAAIALAATFALRSTRDHTPPNASLGLATDSGSIAMPSPSARAELVYASGEVTVAGTSSGVGRTLLAEGTVIETAAGGACVLIDSDINVCLAAHSRMRLIAIATAARRIDLELGSLATRLATQPEGMSLSIVSEGVWSTAIGTAFAVERVNGQSVMTTVLNGKVRVGRGSQTSIVTAHERAVSSAREAITPTISSVGRQDESPSWALLGPTVLWHDPVAATLDVHGEPVAAEVWLDEQWVGVTPLSTLLPTGEHRLAVRKAGKELTARELRLHAGESIEVDYKPTPVVAQRVEVTSNELVKNAKRGTLARPHKHAEQANVQGVQVAAKQESIVNDAASGAELLRRARQAVRAGRFDDAAASYQTVIDEYAGSDEAQTALVLLGQLRLTRLNDPRGALEPLNAYLHTGGSLELEARIARIDALHALARTAEETVAIDDFLRRHPRSFEAKALRARLHAPQSTDAP